MGVCHEIFDLYFVMIRIHPGSGDQQAKVFSNLFSISPRYSIMKFGTLDRVLCMCMTEVSNFRPRHVHD